MKKIGAIYIRVSTDKQEELSPDAQKRLLLEYAASHDIIIPSEYIFQDNGISGRKAEKRPEFQKMVGMAKSKEHDIDCIIVWKFSRFARNQEESILYKSLLKKNNVEVISISESTTGEFGTLIERIIEWMDEYYSIRLSGEVLRGMTESAMRGNYLADPPIGYTHVGNRQPPAVNKDTIIIPKTMKHLFMEEGKSLRKIAEYCNDNGWRTKRGNLFDARDVEYILMNPFYAGKIRWNYTERGRNLKPAEDVILVDGKHEAVWTYEECLNMTSMLMSRKNKSSNKKTIRDVSTCKHWLSGLLVCSSCGRTLAYNGTGKSRGFQCWGYYKGICKVSHYIGANLGVDYVIDGLKNLLHSDCLSYNIVQTISADVTLKVDDLKKQLSRISQRETRAKNAYLDGIDSKEEYKENKEMFQKERSKIQSQIDELSNIDATNKSKSELDNMLIRNIQDVITILENEDIDFEQKGNAIRSIVDHIVFDRTNTSFEFSLKLKL